MMASYIEIEDYDATLTLEQRAALGLGSIGTDPRNAAVKVIIVTLAPNGVRFVARFTYAFERAATTRVQLRDALVVAARVRIAAEQNAAGGSPIGLRFYFE